MNYSYQGVTGELVQVEDKYCPDMGAYQVATIRNAEGDHRVGNKYDTTHKFPAIARPMSYEERVTGAIRSIARKCRLLSAMDSRNARRAALFGRERINRLSAKIN